MALKINLSYNGQTYSTNRGLNMDMYSSLQILISGLVSGLILFQSVFVAPTVFTTLNKENRAPFLRTVFPKLFKAMIAAGLIFLVITFIQAPESMATYLVGTITLLAGIVCNSIIPATNKARDEGHDTMFSLLHRLSVVLTVLTLLVNLLWVFI